MPDPEPLPYAAPEAAPAPARAPRLAGGDRSLVLLDLVMAVPMAAVTVVLLWRMMEHGGPAQAAREGGWIGWMYVLALAAGVLAPLLGVAGAIGLLRRWRAAPLVAMPGAGAGAVAGGAWVAVAVGVFGAGIILPSAGGAVFVSWHIIAAVGVMRTLVNLALLRALLARGRRLRAPRAERAPAPVRRARPGR